MVESSKKKIFSIDFKKLILCFIAALVLSAGVFAISSTFCVNDANAAITNDPMYSHNTGSNPPQLDYSTPNNTSSASGSKASVFSTIAKRMWEIVRDLRKLAYILAGFGMIAFTFGAIFNKISWKHFGNIMISLFILSIMTPLIEYVIYGENSNKKLQFGGVNADTIVTVGNHADLEQNKEDENGETPETPPERDPECEAGCDEMGADEDTTLACKARCSGDPEKTDNACPNGEESCTDPCAGKEGEELKKCQEAQKKDPCAGKEGDELKKCQEEHRTKTGDELNCTRKGGEYTPPAEGEEKGTCDFAKAKDACEKSHTPEPKEGEKKVEHKESTWDETNQKCKSKEEVACSDHEGAWVGKTCYYPADTKPDENGIRKKIEDCEVYALEYGGLDKKQNAAAKKECEKINKEIDKQNKIAQKQNYEKEMKNLPNNEYGPDYSLEKCMAKGISEDQCKKLKKENDNLEKDKAKQESKKKREEAEEGITGNPDGTSEADLAAKCAELELSEKDCKKYQDKQKKADKQAKKDKEKEEKQKAKDEKKRKEEEEKEAKCLADPVCVEKRNTQKAKEEQNRAKKEEKERQNAEKAQQNASSSSSNSSGGTSFASVVQSGRNAMQEANQRLNNAQGVVGGAMSAVAAVTSGVNTVSGAVNTITSAANNMSAALDNTALNNRHEEEQKALQERQQQETQYLQNEYNSKQEYLDNKYTYQQNSIESEYQYAISACRNDPVCIQQAEDKKTSDLANMEASRQQEQQELDAARQQAERELGIRQASAQADLDDRQAQENKDFESQKASAVLAGIGGILSGAGTAAIGVGSGVGGFTSGLSNSANNAQDLFSSSSDRTQNQTDRMYGNATNEFSGAMDDISSASYNAGYGTAAVTNDAAEATGTARALVNTPAAAETQVDNLLNSLNNF